MKKTSKWLALGAMMFGGATLFQSGCLNDFWAGFWNTGWPSDNRWLNLGLDILQEELFG